MSPIFTHGIFPPQKDGLVRAGVPPEVIDEMVSKRVHTQFSGMSIGISSSVIGGYFFPFMPF